MVRVDVPAPKPPARAIACGVPMRTGSCSNEPAFPDDGNDTDLALCRFHYDDLLNKAIDAAFKPPANLAERDRQWLAEFWIRFGVVREMTVSQYLERHDKWMATRGDTPLTRDSFIDRGAPESLVYFARNGNRIKIGTSTNLPHRIRALALPMSSVMATEPGGLRREGELHDRFADLHDSGEWYRAEEPLLGYIATLSN